MQYIAAVSGRGLEVDRVKEQLLQSNPVLEGMGSTKGLGAISNRRGGGGGGWHGPPIVIIHVIHVMQAMLILVIGPAPTPNPQFLLYWGHIE